MRIFSPDGTIEITRGTFENPLDLNALVESRGFAGRVSNVFPSNVGEFFSSIQKIERDNSGIATLLGTEDFVFTIELPQRNGDFWVEIFLSDGFGELGKVSRKVSCRLYVEGEYWWSTIRDLRAELVGGPTFGN